jgi:SAM-dependent methyltransferase
MNRNRVQYLPVLKYDWLTALYDPLLRWTLRETTFKRRLVEQAGIGSFHRTLDLGCGTGTLTLLIKQEYPETEVVGLDGDPKILGLARAKAAKADLDITLDQRVASQLQYADNSFDRVLSSLLFHHLSQDHKLGALQEVFRVLRPSGELHVADWGKPHNGLMRVAFLLVQALDGFETTADNVNGLLPGLFRQAALKKSNRQPDSQPCSALSLCIKLESPWGNRL